MPQKFSQLNPTLWVAQSELYHTNSGIFISEGDVCLVDPAIFPSEIETIAAFVDDKNVRPRFLVITHHHWDHIFGPEHFPGVNIVAQENYLDEMIGKPGAKTRKQVQEWELSHNIKRERSFVIPHPDITFSKTTVLQVGSLSLTLIHSPGHTSDQLVVYHPESATLWAADMLSDLEIPFIGHNLAAHEQTLAMIADLDIEMLVPGHGNPAVGRTEIRSIISGDIDYLAELRSRVARAISDGKTMEEVVLDCTAMKYHHPDENKEAHKLNVESAYLELGGEADPSEFGWEKYLYDD
ncbi:MAG: MBL fold metallo-hydrolase [Anaerolineaceae bacterium]|nr:MBL fold metallo-hydrolase [Anaerolineaceae bacterium]